MKPSSNLLFYIALFNHPSFTWLTNSPSVKSNSVGREEALKQVEELAHVHDQNLERIQSREKKRSEPNVSKIHNFNLSNNQPKNVIRFQLPKARNIPLFDRLRRWKPIKALGRRIEASGGKHYLFNEKMYSTLHEKSSSSKEASSNKDSLLFDHTEPLVESIHKSLDESLSSKASFLENVNADCFLFKLIDKNYYTVVFNEFEEYFRDLSAFEAKHLSQIKKRNLNHAISSIPQGSTEKKIELFHPEIEKLPTKFFQKILSKLPKFSFLMFAGDTTEGSFKNSFFKHRKLIMEKGGNLSESNCCLLLFSHPLIFKKYFEE